MRKFLLKLLLKEETLWKTAGDMAERHYERDSGDYDELHEKLFYWIKCGIFKDY